MANRAPLAVRPADKAHPLDVRIRAYLDAGTEAPVAGRCGSKRRRPKDFPKSTPWRYCNGKPLVGSTRCKVHGGTSRVGPASGTYKDGRYSKLFKPGSPLYEGYRASQRDDELLSLREQIWLCDGRERELVEQIAAGAARSGAAQRDLAAAVKELRGAMASGDAGRFAAAVDRVEQVVDRGGGYDALWAQWADVTELRRKLKETEVRLIERGQHAVPVDQALAYGSRIASMAVAAMGADKHAIARFYQSLKALSAGRSVEDAETVGGS
jgi:hypothetical protein